VHWSVPDVCNRSIRSVLSIAADRSDEKLSSSLVSSFAAFAISGVSTTVQRSATLDGRMPRARK
jgi:hypothetical protein